MARDLRQVTIVIIGRLSSSGGSSVGSVNGVNRVLGTLGPSWGIQISNLDDQLHLSLIILF